MPSHPASVSVAPVDVAVCSPCAQVPSTPGDRVRRWVKHGVVATALASVRRALPGAWVRLLVVLRLGLDRRSPLVVGAAREQVAFLRSILPGIDLGSDDYLVHNAWRSELRWHPELIDHLTVTGIEHLDRARAAGRGVVVTFWHHGPYDGALPSVARAGVPLTVVAGRSVTDPDAPPFLRQHRRVIGGGGNAVVDVSVGSAGIGALLDRGACVALAIDVPGSSVVRVGERRLIGSSGAARLAVRHDAPVVALTCRRGPDGRGEVHLGEPIDPRTVDGPDELLDLLVAHHLEAVRDWPAAYHHPTTRWGTR